MNTPRLHIVAALLAAVGAAACGSSSTTSTAPATVPRCAVSLASTELSVPAGGGGGTLAVTTARECAWTASSNASWLTLRGTPSGQGDGLVEYVAGANNDPAMRRAVIELNDQRANITQPAAECSLTLQESSGSFSPAGGSGTISVRASSAQCSWTAVPDAGWVVIRSGATGAGNGTVTFDVAAATGPPRTATIAVAGLRYSVTQSQGCTYSIAPSSFAPGSGGGQTTVTVSALAGCPWNAASNVPWATVVEGTSGTGPGAARIVVDATSGPSRSGSVLIAGQILAIAQSSGCALSVDPLTQTFGAQGGAGSASISGGGTCAWNATSDVPWITLTGATSGVGNGGVAFSVAPLSGPARTGTISVAGVQISVSQSSGCTNAIAPQSQQVAAAGGQVSVTVTAASGCTWSAVSADSWIVVASGGSGSGNGVVTLSVAATSGGARAGTVTIAGQTFTVSQGGGCTFSINPTSASVVPAGGTGSVAVTAGSGCGWTASSSAPWLTITQGASGSGNGTVQYSAAAGTVGTRSATLTIGGQTFTLTQGSGCTYGIAQSATNVGAAGGTGTVGVTAGAGCAWAAASNVPWATVTQGTSGSGNGTVTFTTAANPGADRSGTLTVAGQTFTINQTGGCSYSAAPTTIAPNALGGSQTVTVTATPNCAWTASSGVSWISVASGATGVGNGSATLQIGVNLAGARTGTATVAGQTITVNQAATLCVWSVNPTSRAATAAGGVFSFNVVVGAGCPWTATSDVPWLSVNFGTSGSGNGMVTYGVLANTTNADRSGTITVAGVKFTVNQAK